MTANEIPSYLSLALAVVFWLLSTKQADDAKKALGEIKSEIITWQAQLNKAAIDIISSRPEVIAKETALAETKSLSEFSTQLLELIKNASSSSLPKNPVVNTNYKFWINYFPTIKPLFSVNNKSWHRCSHFREDITR